MRTTPKEHERLAIFTLAELARRRRSRGRRLNAPEATALICDEMLEAAWDGASLDEVVAVGMSVLREEDVMEGVPDLVARIEIDCLFPSGTSLVVVDEPIGAGSSAAPPAGDAVIHPGSVVAGEGVIVPNAGRRTVDLEVRNDGDRVVFVSSHYPFAQVNEALRFDRERASNMRLDIPAGASLSFLPGESRTVRLVDLGGSRRVPDFRVRRPDSGSKGGDVHG